MSLQRLVFILRHTDERNHVAPDGHTLMDDKTLDGVAATANKIQQALYRGTFGMAPTKEICSTCGNTRTWSIFDCSSRRPALQCNKVALHVALAVATAAFRHDHKARTAEFPQFSS